MAGQEPGWSFYLLTNEPFNAELENNLHKFQNVHVIVRPLPIFRSVSSLWYLLKAGQVVREVKADLFWGPAFLLPPGLPRHMKKLVTVHDMVYKVFPSTMSFGNKLFFRLLHDYSIRSADMIWTNSAYTQQSLEQFFPEWRPERVYTGFFINTDIFRPLELQETEVRSLKQKYAITDKTILFVGTLEPRKNLSFLLSLMPTLVSKGYRLLIIGAKGWGSHQTGTDPALLEQLADSVRFGGFVPTEELVKIYNMAALYLSTSKNEGFGMPQLEAMACGCPVISPHNSAMIEVVEGVGETVKGWGKDDWLKTIERVNQNRAMYAQAGLERVKQYNKRAVVASMLAYVKNGMMPARI